MDNNDPAIHQQATVRLGCPTSNDEILNQSASTSTPIRSISHNGASLNGDFKYTFPMTIRELAMTMPCFAILATTTQF